LSPQTIHEDTDARYERFLEAYLSTELRLVNSGLPRARRTLAELLKEQHPSVRCSDGSDQVFKRSELQFLSGIVEESEAGELLLPVLIEVAGDEHEATVLCSGDVEIKVLSKVLDMPLRYESPGRVRIYKPQLGVLRKRLRTTTQYAFSARTGDEYRLR
jgi:uncharacterized protein (UPF0216 family)